MRNFILFIILCSCLFSNAKTPYDPNGKGRDYIEIIVKFPHLCSSVSVPEIVYHYSGVLSINFGNQPIDNYTVTISTPLFDVDYLVTTSYTTIPLAVDGVSDYTIIIETADGDVFEGILTASDYATSQTI